ncbi:MAG TPA: glutamate-1-semialdehyde-2,1-aminomutase [Deltaproteobacteria bacterium]|nr:glutamate-1-semialdehyde-2,1-aminomutase [Deltaproteobacteria bacterium]
MTNDDLFRRALTVIPGGVNSPVRAFGKVGGIPRFFERAQGPYLWDAEGTRYIDHILSWGPMILGHCHPAVVAAVRNQAGKALSFGAPTELEVRMAELVCAAMPSMEMVRFVSSGTEATMSAIRLARAFTGRDVIVKFAGCYHGHVDSMLVKAGSGALTLGIPDTQGIPGAIASTTGVLPYNDTDAFSAFMEMHGERIAAVIVEPVAGNMGVVPPREGFLATLRMLCSENGTLLIFDEVITGFRFCFGGYQNLIDIRPDLTCLGKIIGGGLPVGAFGGSREVMSLLAPGGPVYQAGTLSGNPMATACGLATLEVLKAGDIYTGLDHAMEKFSRSLTEAATHLGIPVTVNRIGSMAGIFFHEGPVETLDDVMNADVKQYRKFFHEMLDLGIYLAPSPFEALFISAAHEDAVLEQSVSAARRSLARLLQEE